VKSPQKINKIKKHMYRNQKVETMHQKRVAKSKNPQTLKNLPDLKHNF
jgi:hypothetical protein